MYIFTIGDEGAFDSSAYAVAERRWSTDNQQNVLCQFETAHKKNIHPDAVKSMVMLGHSNKETSGEYDVDAFVKQMKRIVPDKNERSKIQHIYVISCEVGAFLRDKPPFAQRIAEILI